jgi:hypothetical protein
VERPPLLLRASAYVVIAAGCLAMSLTKSVSPLT